MDLWWDLHFWVVHCSKISFPRTAYIEPQSAHGSMTLSGVHEWKDSRSRLPLLLLSEYWINNQFHQNWISTHQASEETQGRGEWYPKRILLKCWILDEPRGGWRRMRVRERKAWEIKKQYSFGEVNRKIMNEKLWVWERNGQLAVDIGSAKGDETDGFSGFRRRMMSGISYGHERNRGNGYES